MGYHVRRLVLRGPCRRGRSIPLDLDDYTLRDISFTRAEYRFLVMLGPKVGGFLNRAVVVQPPPDVPVIPGAPGSAGAEVGLFRAIGASMWQLTAPASGYSANRLPCSKKS